MTKTDRTSPKRLIAASFLLFSFLLAFAGFAVEAAVVSSDQYLHPKRSASIAAPLSNSVEKNGMSGGSSSTPAVLRELSPIVISLDNRIGMSLQTEQVSFVIGGMIEDRRIETSDVTVLSQINTRLALQFRLMGSKPSGTM